jgi:hypothetical protein
MYISFHLPVVPVGNAFIYTKGSRKVKDGKGKKTIFFCDASCKKCRENHQEDGRFKENVIQRMESWMLQHIQTCIPMQPGIYKKKEDVC